MFSIKEILGYSYRLYISRFITIVGVTAIVVFLSALFENAVAEIFYYSVIVGIVFAVLFGVIGVIVEIGYTKFMLKLVSGGFPSPQDLLKYSYLFWRYIFGGILLGLVVMGGLVLLVIPGIYFALRFMFVPILIVDKEMRIRDAFARSTVLTQGSKWKLLGLACILIVGQALIAAVAFSNAGVMVEAAGLVLVAPFLVIAYITTYRTLQGL